MGEEPPSRLRIVLRYTRSLIILPFLLTGMVVYAVFAPYNARHDVPPWQLCLLGAGVLLLLASAILAVIWLFSLALF